MCNGSVSLMSSLKSICLLSLFIGFGCKQTEQNRQSESSVKDVKVEDPAPGKQVIRAELQDDLVASPPP